MIKLLGVAIIAGLFFAESDLLAIEAAEVKLPTKPTPSTCPTHIQCWTGWFDRDDPSGTGDWETLSDLRRENPGKICPEPGSMEVTTLSGLSVGTAGEVIFRNDLTDGFVCRNQDQSDRTCNDYRVRFCCPPQYCGEEVTVCWTRWYDRDDPSGTGDWEPLSNLRSENPGQICDNPLYIEAVTTGNNPVLATSTGQTFHV
ncbi:cartilage intermediate layer protein 1-like [Acanthopagrus latus]|uniref:cartilage intermediate layer protein 1-like n=1 Tax=Acanthopagrus latus TaxID=8177 RepID=UPI00187C9D4F|nr:cartilage intermediate layer protein 1-like [Acanthopagrus latus]